MKIPMTLAGAVLLLSGCDKATAPAEVAKTTGSTVERYLSRTLLDGKLNARYVYGANFQLDSLISYDTSGNLAYASGFTYAGGVLTSRDMRDGKGALINRYAYDYDGAGRLTKIRIFSSKDSLTSQTEYTYDAQSRISLVSSSRFKGGQAYANYSQACVYTGNECLQESVMDSAGTVVGILNYTLDDHPYPRSSSISSGSRIRFHNTRALAASGGDSTGTLRLKVYGSGYVLYNLYTSVWVYGADGYPIKETRTATGSAGKIRIFEFQYVN